MTIVNTRILSAWPNWLIVPVIAVFWIVLGVLLADLFDSDQKGNVS